MKKTHSLHRLLSLVLCLCMVLSLVPGYALSALAVEEAARSEPALVEELCQDSHAFVDGQCTACSITGGYCGAEEGGENLTWTLADGVLTVSGTGAMKDFSYTEDPAPWQERCEEVTSILIEDGVTYLGIMSFPLCTNLTEVQLPDSLEGLGYSVFNKCERLESIIIPEKVTEIPHHAFYTCLGLKSVTFKGEVTIIDYQAFQNCFELTNLTIPDSVETIGKSAFHQCISLVHVVIPDKVTTIGPRAFQWCDALESVTIGENVTQIGEYAFQACESMKELIWLAENDVDFNRNAFSYLNDEFEECSYTENLDLVLTHHHADEVTDLVNWNGYTFKSIVILAACIDGTMNHNLVYNDNADGTHHLVCSLCGYEEDGAHIEGTPATCVKLARCAYCDGSYGVVNSDNHNTQLEGATVATCNKLAYCPDCDSEYGQLNPENHTKATYTNGFRDCCGAYQPSEEKNGVYHISNAGNLYWFMEQVNGGKQTINAVLTDHILVNENVLKEDGTLYQGTYRSWTPIGNIIGYVDRPYKGTFDGQGFTISGLYFNENSNRAGVFGEINGGTVRNVGVKDSYFKGSDNIGGVVGFMISGTVENCWNSGVVSGANSVGGVVGQQTDGTVTNCYNTGAVSGTKSVGGVVGVAYKTVANCYNSGVVSGTNSIGGVVGKSFVSAVTNCYNSGVVSGAEYVGGVVGNNHDGNVTNCYYLDKVGEEAIPGGINGTDVAGQAEAKTVDQFASGEVAYLLQSSQAEQVWGQTIGKEAAPVLGGAKIYFGYDSCHPAQTDPIYTNNANASETKPTHSTEKEDNKATCQRGNICDFCGASYGEVDPYNHTATAVFEWPDSYSEYMEVYVGLNCACGEELDYFWVYDDAITVETISGTDCKNPTTATFTLSDEYNGVTYTDTKTYIVPGDPHAGEFVNGFCSACGGFEEAVWNEEEDVYEIYNAGQLYWYAQELNTNNSEIYVKLMKDIVIPETAPNWTPINASYAYFDGNFKTISGLKCIDTDADYVGLFGKEGWWYEISNLHIDSSYFEGGQYVGSIVASLDNGGNVTNCYVTNTTVKGAENGDVGSIVGYLGNGTVANCYTDSGIHVGFRYENYGDIVNSYYLSQEETEDGGKTAAQFASGEVAFLLQSGIVGEDIYDDDWNVIDTIIPQVWGQTIGTDSYPVLGGQKVYQSTNCKNEVAYTNTQGETLIHSYKNGTCTACGEADPNYVSVIPTLTAKYPTVSFEDVIILNIYFDAQNIDDVVEMGMLTFPEKYDAADIALAEEILPGHVWNAGAKLYTASTNGIPAKELGKTIYFAVYAKLADGTYAYSKVSSYSVEKYAKTQLTSASTTAEMKALMVATLNYAAAAQVRFDYNADTLVNASLTDAQKALNVAYSADMITVADKPEGAKLGEMVKTGNYTKFYPTVSFEGAFSINYYFVPATAPVGDITMYVWTQADYAAAESLSKENASYALTMELQENGEYKAIIENIAAKQLNDAVYVSICYNDGTADYCSGVTGYSIGQYCKSQAAKTGAMAELAKATAVYGYYAKQRFG